MNEAILSLLKKVIPSKYHSSLRAIVMKLFFFGLSSLCPLCNSRLRTFLPYGFNFRVLEEKKVVGGGYRKGVVCPVCHSRDRERLIYLFLLHKTDIFVKPSKLLHVAPEPKLSEILRSHHNIDYLSADLDANNVMVEMNITDIDYPDNFFNAIICNHVLEHIIDDVKAMAELFRSLKSGGWAILQVPFSLTLKNTYEDFSIQTNEGREEAFGQADHVRIYAKDYTDRLSQAGFEVNVFKWNSDLVNFGGRHNSFGLNKDESVFFASKSR